MTEPQKSKDHWKYRRLMAFMAFFSFLSLSWLRPETVEYIIWAHIALCAQWAIPAAIENISERYFKK